MRLRHGRPRAGFSLTELLVVMAIITVLLTLSAAATLKYINVQQQSNTEATVRKVQALVEQHWRAVKDQANSQAEIPPVVTAPPDATIDRIVHVKNRLAVEFVTTPAGLH